jgi:glycosyltransferase involved in cell wall biosynthesis
MTAALGAWVARRTDARLYLDIRDIFVDTLKDVAHWAVARGTQPLFSALERWTIGSAATVNLVSAGFGDYFRSRYPGRRFTYFTNGIDDEFLVAARAVQPSAPTIANRPLTVLYAGNIGEGQGLHSILPGLANALGSRVRFQVVGDGGKRRVLEQALAAGRATSVELLAPVGRTELLELYRAADVLFLHLNDHDAFKKVLPSKIFEYAALGKPVWAGVAGYAAEFLRSEVKNSAVFQPCDVQDAVRSLQGLTIGDAARSEFVARYSRARITLELALDVVHVGAGGP